MEAYWVFFLFVTAFVILLTGFPVAFSLGGSALIFSGLGMFFDVFDSAFISAMPERIFGIMSNSSLMAIPLFVFMGIILEKSKISERLLETMAEMISGLKGGLGVSVCLVGGLLAASTGIVGATVVTMGLISLPILLEKKYSPALSAGIICASGTLGQIIPPSIVLIILGDVISSAYQQSQLNQGIFSPESVSVADLFVGAIVPGIILMTAYVLYVIAVAYFFPHHAPAQPHIKNKWSREFFKKVITAFVPPILLIFGVLGSILLGIATPTEAASVGCAGAFFIAALQKKISFNVLKSMVLKTSEINAMVFMILIGASLFSLVFRGFEGDEVIASILTNLPGGLTSSFLIVMLIMFFLGFFLDFFEITFVIVPIVGPILLSMGMDPVWLGVMIALNLQTSFLTPPFGFSLFYLKGVTDIPTTTIYKGVIPFIVIQILVMLLLWFFPSLIL